MLEKIAHIIGMSRQEIESQMKDKKVHLLCKEEMDHFAWHESRWRR